ncbi:Glyoxalase/Bleomycin resistance protein/Dihydroxybiphenyl dioxygenase [Penicillium canariense]|uniref:Glyoxalase/Bleomycin resistance protein/Dihydroxybiphenyl dioxygenase n=1 Tax=Penicillium canariense TaxID=189055 RepID=A0A9W9ICJ8_9EURO|nr:Glyoxalase/Bleomycin resistance protein/Dihydroxybiphenyl dioxygenase [Penicillium canariense]KAJ5174148.1 Glyoxalase/Bleomycin resistance protein/Dihydroxybiphenyl dioxygenase [Penicillium canariense]
MTVDFDAPGNVVKRPSSLAHVFLRTNKFQEMVDFYKKFTGGEARFESSKISFICFDEEHHRIAVAAIPGTTDKMQTSAGLEHIAFSYPTLEDLALAYRQRKQLGMTPTWSVNHGITTSIYYEDPDGNRLETQVDNFDDNDIATEFMMSPEFRTNPIGTDFDPEDLVKRLQSGESEASIKKREETGARGLPAQMK